MYYYAPKYDEIHHCRKETAVQNMGQNTEDKTSNEKINRDNRLREQQNMTETYMLEEVQNIWPC